MFRAITLRILESYFRRPLLNLLPFILILSSGIAFVQMREPAFISRASIAIQEESITETTLGLASQKFVWRTPADATVSDIQELFASNSIIRSIISRTDLEQSLLSTDVGEQRFFDQVRKDIWVQSIGSQHLVVSARANSPELAQQLTNAVVETFLSWNSSLELADAASGIDFFEQQLAQESAEFDAAQAELRQFLIDYPKTFRRERSDVEKLELGRLTQLANQAAARVSYTRGQLDFARQSYKIAETETEQQFLIIDKPSRPLESEYTPFQSAKTLSIFGAVGVALTLLTVIIRAAMDKTFRYPVDLRVSHGLIVLANVPTATQSVHSHFKIARSNGSLANVNQKPIQLATNIDPPTLVLIEEDKEQFAMIARERFVYSQNG